MPTPVATTGLRSAQRKPYGYGLGPLSTAEAPILTGPGLHGLGCGAVAVYRGGKEGGSGLDSAELRLGESDGARGALPDDFHRGAEDRVSSHGLCVAAQEGKPRDPHLGKVVGTWF
jgi:hypothetical protein